MANELYTKLFSLDLLKRAWHLARNDSRTDFIFDSYRYNDYAFRLEENLKGLLSSLEAGTYRPQPLLEIDIPKSTLAVRPGTVVEIEDRIVLFAILCLIAPLLDKKLPDTVYSYRLKENPAKESLFKDTEILNFPFLKKATIQDRLQIFEPWYGQWPHFLNDSQYAYEKEGYNFLSISDISAYFENINLEILRDILLQYLPKQQRIINMLIGMYENWVFKTPDGRSVGRGIPQGNSCSSFLANIYLLPLDQSYSKFAKTYDIKYFRYMDDVKIFSKDEITARQVIFEMNRLLRSLHLNIQGSKTEILRDDEIRNEIEDKRLTRVNEYIKSIQGKQLDEALRKKYIKVLSDEYKKIRKKKYPLKNKELRLFRRLITGFTLLQSGKLVDRLILEIPRNPDYRLMGSAVRYFRMLPNKRVISSKLFEFLRSPENLFAQQEALMIMALRYMRHHSTEVIRYLKKVYKLKKKHWYVRLQALLLLLQISLSEKFIRQLRKEFDEEKNIQVKRAMIAPLCQLKSEELKDFVKKISFDPNHKIGRLGRMLLDLHTDSVSAREEINNLLHDYDEIRLMDGLYKLEIIKYHSDLKIIEILRKRLTAIRGKIKRPTLKIKIEKIIQFLNNRCNQKQLQFGYARENPKD
ncbi:MAG: reverse transcriptase domain-containing protein [Waddliaceae bacterium]